MESERKKMSDRRTMSLSLTEKEMNFLEQMCAEKDMTKSAVMRQALRLYAKIDERLSRGDRLYFEDYKKPEDPEKPDKSEVVVV